MRPQVNPNRHVSSSNVIKGQGSDRTSLVLNLTRIGQSQVVFAGTVSFSSS